MVVAHQKKQRAERNKHSPPSDYDSTILKAIDTEKKKQKMAQKGVP
jgi:hypothetical protein